MKVILNKCFGGFDVSKEAYMLYAKKKGFKLYSYKDEWTHNKIIFKKDGDGIVDYYFTKDFGDAVNISNEDCLKYGLRLNEDSRTDKVLIEVVEELGEKASGRFGKLEVVEIPDNYYYIIDEYDGVETIYYSASKIEEK